MEAGTQAEKKHVVALIPVYEPGEGLIEQLQEIRERTEMSIVVVNDGSSRKCNELFERVIPYGKIVSHSVRRGRGAAIKTGLRYIYENYHKDSMILVLDGEGQYTLEDAVRVIRALELGDQALAVGVRKYPEGTPFLQRLGQSITGVLFHFVAGRELQDTQSTLRAFPAEMIPLMLAIDGDQGDYEVNMLLTCIRRKLPIRQVKIDTPLKQETNTPVEEIWTLMRTYGTIVKLAGVSLLCSLLDILLFCVLSVVTSQKVVISNILARVLSVGARFFVTRPTMPESNVPNKYYWLQQGIAAVLILFMNTVSLNFFATRVNINPYAAKILVEILMFFFIWGVRQLVVLIKEFFLGRQEV